ncbi:hypothetical protein DC31_16850 [Microbacterium sp. CH12i]|nr:hypothetical protein DC31_16850 [Microbacterium sp. CH12i]
MVRRIRVDDDGDAGAPRDLFRDIRGGGVGSEVDVRVLDTELIELLLGASAVAAPFAPNMVIVSEAGEVIYPGYDVADG